MKLSNEQIKENVHRMWEDMIKEFKITFNNKDDAETAKHFFYLGVRAGVNITASVVKNTIGKDKEGMMS